MKKEICLKFYSEKKEIKWIKRFDWMPLHQKMPIFYFRVNAICVN